MVRVDETYDLADDKQAVKIQSSTKDTDRAANKLIRPYQGMVALPSILMGFGVVFSFITVVTLGAMGIIPLWVGLILNSLVLYAAQTPGAMDLLCGSII